MSDVRCTCELAAQGMHWCDLTGMACRPSALASSTPSPDAALDAPALLPGGALPPVVLSGWPRRAVHPLRPADDVASEVLVRQDRDEWDKYRDEAGNPAFDGYDKSSRPADEVDGLIGELLAAKANGDPERYIAGVSVATAHRIAAALSRLQASDREWGRLHQQVIDERAEALRSIDRLQAELDEANAANRRRGIKIIEMTERAGEQMSFAAVVGADNKALRAELDEAKAALGQCACGGLPRNPYPGWEDEQ